MGKNKKWFWTNEKLPDFKLYTYYIYVSIYLCIYVYMYVYGRDSLCASVDNT